MKSPFSLLIDQAINGNLLNLVDALHRSPIPDDRIGHKYPPSNISMLNEHSWLIELAVAGFQESDLKVTLQKDNVLEVTGRILKEEEHNNDYESALNPSQSKPKQTFPTYIRRGIGMRSFTEQYSLAEGAKVTKVELKNGLLKIRVEREPPKQPEAQVFRITHG